jgi:hypothetical protein
MKKIIIISCTLLLINIFYDVRAYDVNEYEGKVWRKECKKEDIRMIKCCKKKENKCKGDSPTKQKKKDCKKRYKTCNSIKIVAKQKTIQTK